MIGVVILNYNTWQDTIRCVKSVLEHTESEVKIYIVDNHSTDHSLNELAAFASNTECCTLIRAPYNRGYSAGNNIGLNQAFKDGVESLAVLNSDVILLNGALDSMQRILQANFEIGIVGPSVILPSGEESQVARNRLTLLDYILDRKPFNKICYLKKYSKRYYDWEKSVESPFIFEGMVSGCCFMISAQIFEKIGDFDEHIFLYCEEDALAYKLKVFNYKAAIDSKAKVLHNHHSSIMRRGNAFARYYLWLSPIYVLRAYSGINNFILFIMVCKNIGVWSLLSLADKEYRKLIKSFIKHNVNLFKITKASELLRCKRADKYGENTQ